PGAGRRAAARTDDGHAALALALHGGAGLSHRRLSAPGPGAAGSTARWTAPPPPAAGREDPPRQVVAAAAPGALPDGGAHRGRTAPDAGAHRPPPRPRGGRPRRGTGRTPAGRRLSRPRPGRPTVRPQPARRRPGVGPG